MLNIGKYATKFLLKKHKLIGQPEQIFKIINILTLIIINTSTGDDSVVVQTI